MYRLFITYLTYKESENKSAYGLLQISCIYPSRFNETESNHNLFICWLLEHCLHQHVEVINARRRSSRLTDKLLLR